MAAGKPLFPLKNAKMATPRSANFSSLMFADPADHTPPAPADVDVWLRERVVPRMASAADDDSDGLSVDEVRALLGLNEPDEPAPTRTPRF